MGNRSAGIKAVLLLFCLFIITLTACHPANFLYTKSGAVECGADGNPILLKDNPDASDPTFDELAAFIFVDPTDTRAYIDDVYVCADFAETLHNNAEVAGIRAGWVSITFSGTDTGHAVNAFHTSDRGLVYIDCTNGADMESNTKNWDMVAYLASGEKYGVIRLERILDTGYDYYPLTYEYYQSCESAWHEYKTLLTAYNADVDAFNREVLGMVYTIGTPEEERMSAWKDELVSRGETLDAMEQKIGGEWYESEYSSYTVSDVLIHWSPGESIPGL